MRHPATTTNWGSQPLPDEDLAALLHLLMDAPSGVAA